MNKKRIAQYGDELYQALVQRKTVKPLTERQADLTVEDAYKISLHMLERRLAVGEKVVGKKIGVTSKVVMDMLGVGEPDFGYLTNSMVFSQGQDMPISERLIQPKAEGEIAFVLKRDICGPGVNNAMVLAAMDFVMPCIEVVDSRVEQWRIKIEDTVADNASSGLLVLGDRAVDPRQLDLATCGMVVEKNGVIVSTGAGAAAMASPVNCVTWLANTLGTFGIPLKAGEIILSGSLVPMELIKPGDSMRVSIGGIGTVSVRFT